MKAGAPGSFGVRLKGLREIAGFTQEELATIAGLSVHAVSALERGQRRRPHVETVRALCAALDLTTADRDALVGSSRASFHAAAVDELSGSWLPLPPTVLVGRDADVRILRTWLADPSVRLVTLVGPGGVGKTRLALEVANGLAQEGSTRVVFVPLSAVRDAAFVASAIAEALGLADVTALDLTRRARVACEGAPTVWVLDNFEQVLDAAPLIADFLRSVQSLQLVITSRAPLRVRGEREYAVGPLTLQADAEALPPADLARAPAVRLFLERVRDARPDFRLTRANGPVVTAICRRLDGLPLGLELAAPWLKVLTAEELLSRLTRNVLLATDGARDLPARQQTMNATVAWSYQLLGAANQQAFRRLGVLPGRFSIEAAAAVLAGIEGSTCRSADALSAVAALIDKSLLQRGETPDADRPRYQMLETVRAYALGELGRTGERDDALEGLVGYCIAEASLTGPGLGGPAQLEWLRRVADDLETYRSGLAWLIGRGRADEASRIASSLMAFWLMRGHMAEGLQWYEQILNLPSLAPAAESRPLVGAALMWYTQGELGRAASALTRAIGIARDGSDIQTFVMADNLLAHVEQARNNVTAARDGFSRSLEGFRALGIPWGIGNALSGMAKCALVTGDTDEAERLLIEATMVLRQAGPWFLAPVLNVRAILAVRRGNADEAIALARENLLRMRDLNDKFAFVYALVALAAAAGLKRHDAWAARILGALDAVSERTGAMVVDQFVNDVREHAERQVRARLGADRWFRAHAAGRETSLDSLLGASDGETRAVHDR